MAITRAVKRALQNPAYRPAGIRRRTSTPRAECDETCAAADVKFS